MVLSPLRSLPTAVMTLPSIRISAGKVRSAVTTVPPLITVDIARTPSPSFVFVCVRCGRNDGHALNERPLEFVDMLDLAIVEDLAVERADELMHADMGLAVIVEVD